MGDGRQMGGGGRVTSVGEVPLPRSLCPFGSTSVDLLLCSSAATTTSSVLTGCTAASHLSTSAGRRSSPPCRARNALYLRHPMAPPLLLLPLPLLTTALSLSPLLPTQRSSPSLLPSIPTSRPSLSILPTTTSSSLSSLSRTTHPTLGLSARSAGSGGSCRPLCRGYRRCCRPSL